MNRRLNNTEFYEFYNANPHNHSSEDCVIRALAVAMNKSWETVYKDLVVIGLKYGYVINDAKCYERYLKQEGWIKCSEPRNWDNTRMKVYQFLKYNKEGNLFVHAGTHHVTAVKDGKVYDIWNSSKQTMHSYWKKDENDDIKTDLKGSIRPKEKGLIEAYLKTLNGTQNTKFFAWLDEKCGTMSINLLSAEQGIKIVKAFKLEDKKDSE